MSDQGVSTPYKVLMLIAIVLTFEAVFLSSDLIQNSADAPDNPERDYDINDPKNNSTFDFNEDPGVFGPLDAVWSAVSTFFGLLTFNVPGAPGWIRATVTTGLIGGLAWSLAALIRGA